VSQRAWGLPASAAAGLARHRRLGPLPRHSDPRHPLIQLPGSAAARRPHRGRLSSTSAFTRRRC
jgi:hypothetical protein